MTATSLEVAADRILRELQQPPPTAPPSDDLGELMGQVAERLGRIDHRLDLIEERLDELETPAAAAEQLERMQRDLADIERRTRHLDHL